VNDEVTLPGSAPASAGPANPQDNAGPAGPSGPSDGVAAVDLVGRKLAPVAEVAVLSMVFVIVGGIYMAAHLPKRPPLGVAEVLTCLAAAALFANTAQLMRLQDFSWRSFFLVAKWALLAYLVIAGMLEFIFVFDGTRGTTLVLMTCMLAIFAFDVPMLLAFSVARYQDPPPATGSTVSA